MGSFEGELVRITGAATGIGLAAAIQFAARGAQLVTVRRSVPLQALHTEADSKIDFIVADSAHANDASRAVATDLAYGTDPNRSNVLIGEGRLDHLAHRFQPRPPQQQGPARADFSKN